MWMLRLADIRAGLQEEAERCRDQAALTKNADRAQRLKAAAQHYENAAAEIVRGVQDEQHAHRRDKHHGEDI
jgi:hypothetical protein